MKTEQAQCGDVWLHGTRRYQVRAGDQAAFIVDRSTHGEAEIGMRP